MCRTVLLACCLGRILFGGLERAAGSDGSDAVPRPNIVFMMADDLGWGDVGFHGGPVATPNLDSLAKRGVELGCHYVAPVCSPTRAALLTGRYWSRFGVTTPTNQRVLPWDTWTLPRALEAAGYATCLVGKWHLGSKPAWGPQHFGFGHSYGSLAGGVTAWSHRYKRGPFSRTWHRNGRLLDEEGHVTDLLAAEAVAWIRQNRDRPFFLYVPFTAVHLPIHEPLAWQKRVPNRIKGDVARHYVACVLHLDHAVGRIMEAIEKIGKSRQTIVVFTSDNGGSVVENRDERYPELRSDCPRGNLIGNNGPFRGHKGQLYEGGIRVPTVAVWPGRFPAGRRIETPVHIVDWMPTLCHLAGVSVDPQRVRWDGRSLHAVLQGEGELAPRALYWAGPRFRSFAVRRGPWKLIVHQRKKGARRVELFHLGRDVSERRNLAQAHPEQVRRLEEVLEAFRAKDGTDAVRRDRPKANSSVSGG